MTPLIDSPCLGCEVRAVGCHATCELFRHYQQDNAAVKAQFKKEAYGKHDALDYTIKNAIKRRKERRKRGRL